MLQKNIEVRTKSVLEKNVFRCNHKMLFTICTHLYIISGITYTKFTSKFLILFS